MKQTLTRTILLLGFCLLLMVGCSTKAPPTEKTPSEVTLQDSRWPTVSGAIIHSLVPKGSGEIYGFREGDILIGWKQNSESMGAVQSPFQARSVENRWAPQGDLQVKILRHGEPLWITTASGRWEIELRAYDPGMSPNERIKVQELFDDPQSFQEPAALWQKLARVARDRQANETARWYHFQGGRARVINQQPDLADQAFREARSDYGALEPSLEAVLHEREAVVWAKAKYKKRAEKAIDRALDLQRRENPASVAVAADLIHLTELAPFSQRRPYLLEARAILEGQAPHSVEYAHVLNHLGIIAWEVDRRIDQAIAFYSQALELRQRLIPESYWIGASFQNLASCARLQGRLDDAESLIKTSIENYPDRPRFAPNRAGAFNTLGLIHRDKGSYSQARESWETALSLYRDLDPGGRAVAGVSNNLGNLSLRLGDLDRARDRYLESLDTRRKLFPDGSASIADSLNNLGIIAKEQGRYAEAHLYFSEALELKQRLAPNSLSLANTLQNLGNLAMVEGRPGEAIPILRQALEMRREIAPRSVQVAEDLILLGRAMLQNGQISPGIDSWQKGIDLLDDTRGGFRFSAQERSVFASRFQDHYRDLAANLVDQGRIYEAFNLLERSRARALRMMAFQEAVAPETHKKSPNWAELPAFSWPEVRDHLDPGTAMVMYSVGQDQTLIFFASNPAESNSGLTIHRVPIGREVLVHRVDLFRSLIARGRVQAQIEEALIQQAKSLFDLLLEPVEQQLQGAQRLLIIPDRPLTTLPFAALVRTEDPLQFVGHWKPMSFAVSGTTFALSVNRRSPKRGPPTLTVYARSTGFESPKIGSPSWPNLPGVALESELIANLFEGHSKVLVDDTALEATFKATQSSLSSGHSSPPHYLHFATHALTNSRAPLESSLVLGAGQGEDGLLSAQEIIDSLQLDHDLVTLSACETGLGRDLGGEGVLGLSHAFLFSGAHSILTSLWQVSDQSTAHWMESFYTDLLAGTPRDHAVMNAQLRTMELEDISYHPYFWAAFQLWGDWSPSEGQSE